MKKTAGLLAILIALLLGGYYGMGVVTERTVKNNLETINKTNGLSVRLLNYHRGWFKSDADLHWTMHIPAQQVKLPDGQSKTIPAQDHQLQMPLKIHHGPIIFADKSVKFGLGYARTEIPMPSEFDEQFKSKFTADSTKPELDLSLFINYLNQSRVNMVVPSFNLSGIKDNSRFEWKGMDSGVSLSSSADKMDGDVLFKGFNFTKEDIQVALGETTIDYRLNKQDKGLLLGDINVSIPSLLIKNQTQKLFELNNLDFFTSSDGEGDLLNTETKVSVDKIIARDKTYGPGKLKLILKNLDANAVLRLNKMGNRASESPDSEKQKIYLSMLGEIPKLLSHGPEFEVSTLEMNVPEGVIEGNAHITVPKMESGNPFELIQKIQGNAKLKLPGAVLKQLLNISNQQKMTIIPQVQTLPKPAVIDPAAAAQPVPVPAEPTAQLVALLPDPAQVSAATDRQMANMVQSGFLVPQDADYVIEVNFENSRLMINNKPFKPAMLQY